MERCKQMIHLRDLLQHAVIVGIFGLKCELEVGSADGASEAIRVAHPPIRAEFYKGRVAAPEEPQPGFLVNPKDVGSSIYGLNEIIIEVWRADSYLGLFHPKESIVVPRSLTECDKRHRVGTAHCIVSFSCSTNLILDLRLEQSRGRIPRLEHDGVQKDFAAV